MVTGKKRKQKNPPKPFDEGKRKAALLGKARGEKVCCSDKKKNWRTGGLPKRKKALSDNGPVGKKHIARDTNWKQQQAVAQYKKHSEAAAGQPGDTDVGAVSGSGGGGKKSQEKRLE